MAEEKLDDIEVVDGDNAGKSKKMMMIIAVVVLALIGGGAAMFLGGDSEETAEEEVTEAEVVKQSPIFVAIEKPLIVSFSKQSNGAIRYLQVKVEVMARDQQVIDTFNLHLPAIKHELLLLMLSQKYDSLNSPEGNDILQQHTFTAVNAILANNKSEPLEAVYTDFLMQ